MGLKNLLGGKEPAAIHTLPSGSVTVDSGGELITSTVPRGFSPSLLKEIGREFHGIFEGAKKAGLAADELLVHYRGLKVTARELRGGAIIFFSPIK